MMKKLLKREVQKTVLDLHPVDVSTLTIDREWKEDPKVTERESKNLEY